MIARQVLQLSTNTVTIITQPPPPEPIDRKGLVIGVVVAVVVLLLLLTVAAAIIVIGCRFHRTKKYVECITHIIICIAFCMVYNRDVTINQAPDINIEGVEPVAYEQFRIETNQPECSYSKLQVIMSRTI